MCRWIWTKGDRGREGGEGGEGGMGSTGLVCKICMGKVHLVEVFVFDASHHFYITCTWFNFVQPGGKEGWGMRGGGTIHTRSSNHLSKIEQYNFFFKFRQWVNHKRADPDIRLAACSTFSTKKYLFEYRKQIIWL